MDSKDQELVHTARERGIAILPGFLSADELETLRSEFTQAYEDAGLGEMEPGKRVALSGISLFRYPSMRRLFTHPRILNFVSAITGEPTPWIWQIKTNRYTPVHEGVGKHTDGFPGEVSPPHTRQSMAVFLDDIREESGALTYVPGSHKHHYEVPNNPEYQPPTNEDIHGEGYIPAELEAGSVLFRVPEVWHAVNPIHHLRRYVTVSYSIRGRVSEVMQQKISETMRTRRESEEPVPEEAREYWDYGAASVRPVPSSGRSKKRFPSARSPVAW